MSAADWVCALLLAALWTAVTWLHGFERGRRDMRRQVVGSLRFGAALRRTLRATDSAVAKADALDEAADRFEANR
ncbi:MAG TPA: hypothetical protein VFJ19_09660 [Nocardioidaceae bacterium]|nr:hypothetical protein [Nocardioidaceae bacterium]